MLLPNKFQSYTFKGTKNMKYCSQKRNKGQGARSRGVKAEVKKFYPVSLQTSQSEEPSVNFGFML